MHESDDLILKLLIEGKFHETLELEDFPFDVQQASLDLAFMVRTIGNAPIRWADVFERLIACAHMCAPGLVFTRCPFACCRLGLARDMQLGITVDSFLLGNDYRVIGEVGKDRPLVTAEPHEVGTTNERMFPSIKLSVYLQRRPKFYIINISFPMMVFAALTFLQYEIEPSKVGIRLGNTLTLVLTAAAFKFGVAGLVPSLCYLTLIDHYIFAMWGFIIFATVAGAIIPRLSPPVPMNPDAILDIEDDDVPAPRVSRFRLLAAAKRGAIARNNGNTSLSAEALALDEFLKQLSLFLFALLHVYFVFRVAKIITSLQKLTGERWTSYWRHHLCS
jgi:hypothetical protein